MPKVMMGRKKTAAGLRRFKESPMLRGRVGHYRHHCHAVEPPTGAKHLRATSIRPGKPMAVERFDKLWQLIWDCCRLCIWPEMAGMQIVS